MDTNTLISCDHSEIVPTMYFSLCLPCHLLLRFTSFDHLAEPLAIAHQLTKLLTSANVSFQVKVTTGCIAKSSSGVI